jgi:hypothetical protein
METMHWSLSSASICFSCPSVVPAAFALPHPCYLVKQP